MLTKPSHPAIFPAGGRELKKHTLESFNENVISNLVDFTT